MSFPPHLVRDYLDRFKLGPRHKVLDPFCGTGTTLVECKRKGVPSIGIEANPLLALASQVKVDWAVDANDLDRHAQKIAALATRRLREQGIEDVGDAPLFAGSRRASYELRRLPKDTQKLLLANSISPKPLHKTLVLLEVMEENEDPRFTPHERLALAKALVSGISNLEFGPEVGVGRPKADAPVVPTWLHNVEAVVSDLPQLRERSQVPATVCKADARQLLSVIESCSIDGLITSPPYPNEKDYTRTTRLESVLLGLVRSKEDLRSLKQSLIRSNTRGVYKGDCDHLLIENHTEIQRIASQIEDRRIELGKTSGFERLYSRVTKLYFGGMLRHLREVRSALRPGAHCAYVVGDQASYLRVMIRTGELIADIARSLGFEVVGIDLFRTRLATATREQLREEVVVLRWPGFG